MILSKSPVLPERSTLFFDFFRVFRGQSPDFPLPGSIPLSSLRFLRVKKSSRPAERERLGIESCLIQIHFTTDFNLKTRQPASFVSVK